MSSNGIGAGLGAMFGTMGQRKVNDARMSLMQQRLSQEAGVQQSEIGKNNSETALNQNQLDALQGGLERAFEAQNMPHPQAHTLATAAAANAGRDLNSAFQGVGRANLLGGVGNASQDAAAAGTPLFDESDGSLYNKFTGASSVLPTGAAQINQRNAVAGSDVALSTKYGAQTAAINAVTPPKVLLTQAQTALANARTKAVGSSGAKVGSQVPTTAGLAAAGLADDPEAGAAINLLALKRNESVGAATADYINWVASHTAADGTINHAPLSMAFMGTAPGSMANGAPPPPAGNGAGAAANGAPPLPAGNGAGAAANGAPGLGASFGGNGAGAAANGMAPPQLQGAAPAAPAGAPPGTQRAPDGNFYAPDPTRPGKYVQVGG